MYLTHLLIIIYSFLKVLIADALVYIPAVLVFCFVCLGRKPALNKVRLYFLGLKKAESSISYKSNNSFHSNFNL